MNSLFTIVALFAVLAAAAAGGLYLHGKSQSGGGPGLFTPRARRLGLIERAHLDGGRKLLLVRRDNVEHLILVGGPIDLIVENGIVRERLEEEVAGEISADEPYAYPGTAERQRADPTLPMAKSAGPAAVPRIPLAPAATDSGGDTLELTARQEAKAAL